MDISPSVPKRKREESRYAVDLGRSRGATAPTREENDCFQEAFAGHLLTTNNDIRSSWLTNEHYWTHESLLHTTRRHYGAISLQEQIKATQQQLVQIKRRFGPLSEHCALVSNSVLCNGEETSPSREFQQARGSCNPFEDLHLDGMFLNRAGIKLANIDALVHFSLTHCEGGYFTFVDLCGAPGGFSEYLMKRCQSLPSIHSCRGWGMSLRGMNEHGHGAPWKLQHMIDDTTNTGTHTHYEICNGTDGTGDVYLWTNVEALAQVVNEKVDLVVADGGFDAQRNAECQEEVACKIIACQASAALVLLKKGGTFVMKMFGFQTSIIRRMMKELVMEFDKITVVKPISSRPASAERYVVFQGFKGASPDFDGLKWQQNVLLGGVDNSSGDTCSELESNLLHCLDECDRDMLQLNQKACFEILSYMERKARGISAPSDTKPQINQHAYKQEWRLANKDYTRLHT